MAFPCHVCFWRKQGWYFSTGPTFTKVEKNCYSNVLWYLEIIIAAFIQNFGEKYNLTGNKLVTVFFKTIKNSNMLWVFKTYPKTIFVLFNLTLFLPWQKTNTVKMTFVNCEFSLSVYINYTFMPFFTMLQIKTPFTCNISFCFSHYVSIFKIFQVFIKGFYGLAKFTIPIFRFH